MKKSGEPANGEARAEHRERWAKRVTKLRGLVRRTQAEEKRMAEEYKEAKAATLAARKALYEVIDNADQMELPLDNGERSDESWMAVTLEDAIGEEVGEALVAKLRAENLDTLGDLTEWLSADGGKNKLTDIAGLGPQKADKIEAALEKFWEKRKEAVVS